MTETEQSNDDRYLPLLYSTLAGLSTCLGAAVVFCKRPGPKHLSFSLALAGSVMVTVSVASILPESFTNEDETFLAIGSMRFWERCLGLAVGCGLYLLLSKCAFPEPDDVLGFESHSSTNTMDTDDTELQSPTKNADTNTTARRKRSEGFKITPDEDEMLSSALQLVDSQGKTSKESVSGRAWWSGSDLTTDNAKRAWRVALLLFVSLAVHNFPEGLAVAASTMHSSTLGVTTSIAIALHNIPEGIAIAVPCLAARPDSPWLAFGLASLSGLAEPLGAAVAILVLQDSDDENASFGMKNVLAFVAGIMCMVAIQELFPEGWRYANESKDKMPFVLGTLAGMIVMLASDAVLEA